MPGQCKFCKKAMEEPHYTSYWDGATAGWKTRPSWTCPDCDRKSVKAL